MGSKPDDRSSLAKLVSALFKTSARLAQKVLRPESKPQPPPRQKAARSGNTRSGHSGNRRNRRKNIAATIERWQAAEKRVQTSSAATEPPPYQRAPRLLTEGEYAFWVPLFHAVKGKYRIFCKVRLADIVCCPEQRKDERFWFRKIGNYHVDFVICDPETTRPLLVIELDDCSHRDGTAQRRGFDAWKDEALRAAGMPVYRAPTREAYDVQALADVVERMIAQAAK
jgi:hypothetical protein